MWIILWHPKLLELNIIQNHVINVPFLFTCPQFINSPSRVKWNRIQNPYQQFSLYSAIFFPQSYGQAIFRAPQSINRTYFVLHHQQPYLVHKNLKQMHLHMTNKDILAIIKMSHHSNIHWPKIWNQGFLKWIAEWMDDLVKSWMLSSNPPWHNYFSLSISLTNIQDFYKKPQLNFFKNFAKSSSTKKCYLVMIVVIFHTIVHLKKQLL
jgi:hypothetical protein